MTDEITFTKAKGHNTAITATSSLYTIVNPTLPKSITFRREKLCHSYITKLSQNTLQKSSPCLRIPANIC